jgi:redox-sensitive bicupin YhaK (pirin superfamily)
MTAARGIIHEEYHSRAMAKTGGTLEMVQLWVNLPKEFKMVAPRYQPILNKDIPVVPVGATEEDGSTCSEPGARVRVISGEFHHGLAPGTAEGLVTKGPALTYSPVDLWDVAIDQVQSLTPSNTH